MRELKFRIWSEEDKEYRSDIRVSDLVIDIDGAPSTIYSAEGDRFDIEQYTGLKDKNGEEIYEGDIVENTYENVGKVRYEVKWDCGRFIMTSKNPYNLVQIGMGIYPNSSKVIGNIHENPGLLGDTNVTNKEEE